MNVARMIAGRQMGMAFRVSVAGSISPHSNLSAMNAVQSNISHRISRNPTIKAICARGPIERTHLDALAQAAVTVPEVRDAFWKALDADIPGEVRQILCEFNREPVNQANYSDVLTDDLAIFLRRHTTGEYDIIQLLGNCLTSTLWYLEARVAMGDAAAAVISDQAHRAFVILMAISEKPFLIQRLQGDAGS